MKLHPFTLHYALLFCNNIPSASQPSIPALQVFADFFATVSYYRQSYEAALKTIDNFFALCYNKKAKQIK